MHICVGNAINFPANNFTHERGQPLQAQSAWLGPDRAGPVRKKKKKKSTNEV